MKSAFVETPGLAVSLSIFALFRYALAASTWCGKNYFSGDHVTVPEGQFSGIPEALAASRSQFQCLPRIQPLTEADDCNAFSILVSIVNAPYYSPDTSVVKITIGIEGPKVLINHVVDLTGKEYLDYEVSVSICHAVSPRRRPFALTCRAEIQHHDDQSIILNATSDLSYIPSAETGSVTQLDRKTGALLVQSTSGVSQPIFPIGFYTDFGGYLAKNLTVLDELQQQGFNVVHPVPPFEDTTALEAILSRMDEIGLYMMYDMRHTYRALEALTEEVERIKAHKSLLLWYTADEPDGPGDPLDATKAAYDRIYELDGYHPVSLALNCQDYFFKEYVSGADIVLPDVYMIGVNTTFSSKYNTPCTRAFGCCGCDNCQGRFEDLQWRLDETKERLKILGWDKTKFVWSVTQAFGGSEFWSRAPSGREWLVQAIISINHGARGIIPWIDPTPEDIKKAASRLALVLPKMTRFLFDANVSFNSEVDPDNSLDMASWEIGKETLWLVANLSNDTRSLHAGRSADTSKSRSFERLLTEHCDLSPEGLLSVGPLGSAVLVVTESELSTTSTASNAMHDEL